MEQQIVGTWAYQHNDLWYWGHESREVAVEAAVDHARRDFDEDPQSVTVARVADDRDRLAMAVKRAWEDVQFRSPISLTEAIAERIRDADIGICAEEEWPTCIDFGDTVDAIVAAIVARMIAEGDLRGRIVDEQEIPWAAALAVAETAYVRRESATA